MEIGREACLTQVVRHDIKNALAATLGYSEILIQDDEISSEMIKDHLKNVRSISLRMGEMLKESGSEEDIAGEIRVLLGTSEILVNLSSDPFIAKIHEAAIRIKHIADTARVCRGNSYLKEFLLSQVVEQECRGQDLALSATKRSLKFQADCLFSRVLGNLFQNAKRHGNASTIFVEVEDHNGNIIIVVRDNGRGIASQIKESIFDKGVTTKVGEPGGDGLFLCRRILSLTGASIEETSQEGEGARFEITLPRKDILFMS